MPDINNVKASLDAYYAQVDAVILQRQNPATGLIPASTAVTIHGNYTDSWTRDNVYSILAVWGLSLAYRRIDDNEGRAYELEHATIKCMRGLLYSMMRQAHKVERFKNTQNIYDSLHAKYSTTTGETVVRDHEWGHLQIDATSIFLLFLAQMTTAGTLIIHTMDEVHFVQNLVFYIERAYRTPDYGIWERGNKSNHGQPELNSSSIGMAVAALQAINGVNLFGKKGGPASVVHVLPDEITRNYDTLHNSLPRESNSKEVDSAVLSVISFPAFAVSDPQLVQRTKDEIVKKLRGNYGFKRFLRDGHQTVLEDHTRLHYEPHELKIFEHIECEWPLFYTYMILDGLFREDAKQVEEYSKLLEPLLVPSFTPGHSRHRSGSSIGSVEQRHFKLVPELYIVPKDQVEAEKLRPGTVLRVPNENVPLVWAQSLYILGCLIKDDLLSPAELDPLNRRSLPFRPKLGNEIVVQVALLAENAELQAKLAMYGLETQTVEGCSPITISTPSALRDAYTALGESSKLNLSGRPRRPIGSVGTSKLYKCQGKLYAFLPHFMDREEFYLVGDNDYLVSVLEQEIAFVKNHWWYQGRPTIVIMMTKEMLGGFRSSNNRSARRWTYQTKASKGNLAVRVRVGRLSEMVNTACVESLDFLLLAQPAAEYEDWHDVLKGESTSKKRLLANGVPAEESRGNLSSKSGSASTRSRSMRRRSSGELARFTGLGRSSASNRSDYDLRKFSVNNLSGPDAKLTVRALSPQRGAVSNRAVKSPLGEVLPPTTQGAIDGENQPPPLLVRDSFIFDITDSPLEQQPLNKVASSAEDRQSPLLEEGLLTLNLKDPSHVKEAIELLKASTNLFDQVDLLQYLLSCFSLSYEVEQLGTLESLLQEIYELALANKEWTVVVNSLTINVADLLIRGKPLTIGWGDNEHFILNPQSPEVLTETIFARCVGDVREAALVQEIITYLGSLIRSTPKIFEGIQREISRMKQCDEEDAVENMMQLSPFELKSLLAAVLTAHENVDDLYEDQAGSYPSRKKAVQVRRQSLEDIYKFATSGHALEGPDQLFISVQSAGFSSGNFARIEVRRDGAPVVLPGLSGRGLHVVVLDPFDSSLLESTVFDTHSSREACEDFTRLIESLEPNTIVIIAAQDECRESLSPAAVNACESLGSDRVRSLKYRDSWLCHHADSGQPTPIMTKEIDLATWRRKFASGSPWSSPPGSPVNDGALNRVPPDFYPKVWKILSRCNGILVGKALLPQHPTVSEKTPEEFNFALQVESYLDVIRDPAERQIAVECLMVISRMSERNPEIQITSGDVNLLQIMDDAVSLFWASWNAANASAAVVGGAGAAPANGVAAAALDRKKGSVASIKDAGVAGAAANSSSVRTSRSSVNDVLLTAGSRRERLARRVFYDLPMEGRFGTMTFLARSCVRLCFDVCWSGP
ncbi:glycosyl hydrolases family 15-domain-containing protein [Zopfochytrium polystomum]|nr:glycosyl hydrolases family 15-domain-containing protein [Zopfochytrium polystomum]